MNTTNTVSMTRRFATAALAAFAALCSCEASLVKMGFNKHKMPVDVDSVLHTFDRARRLQFFEMRSLQATEGETVAVAKEDETTEGEAIAEEEDHQHDHDHNHDKVIEEFDFEDVVIDIESVEEAETDNVENEDVVVETESVEEAEIETDTEESEEESHSEKVEEFVEIQEELHSNATLDLQLNETKNATLDLEQNETKESLFFGMEDPAEQEPAVEAEPVAAEAEDLTTVAGPISAQFATETVTESAADEPVVEETVVIGRNSVETGPRGGTADASPKIQPTEISFMIVMEDFRYSDGIESLDDITIGTKFGFSGRIVTQAEELGVASGSCTVTSALNKELSYCDIYHKIDTDNFGGYGSVVIAGTADEVGGRLLVTGTGGSLQSTNKGYAMVQFDPAGNPVLYVLLKLV